MNDRGLLMNISTRKLFAAQKITNIKFANAQLLDIPKHKTFSDILPIFQNTYIKDNPLEHIDSIDDFILGYNLLLNLKLKELERLQLKILTHGMCKELFNNFSTICNTKEDDTGIIRSLEDKCLKYSNLKACIAGFKAAQNRLMEVCQYILKEQSIRDLQNECIYTNFWDFTHAEIVRFASLNQVH